MILLIHSELKKQDPLRVCSSFVITWTFFYSLHQQQPGLLPLSNEEHKQEDSAVQHYYNNNRNVHVTRAIISIDYHSQFKHSLLDAILCLKSQGWKGDHYLERVARLSLSCQRKALLTK